MLVKKFPYPILLLSFLFTIKALYLAFYVTPLWDIPDEYGHYAYALDLAEGRGIPVLRNAWINSDIMAHVTHNNDAQPSSNWIAQHPPIYYLLAAIPIKIGILCQADQETLYRLPRIVAAFSGGLLLLVLFRTMQQMKLDDYRATLLAASIGFIPMVTHLSSGTNHDMTLFLFSALMAHFLARFLLHHNMRDAYWSALWMTLAAGVKMTAWVLIPPALVIIALEMKGPTPFWARHFAGVSAVTLAVPLAWMMRNYYYFNNPFYLAHTKTTPHLEHLQTPLTDSFFTYISSLPVLDSLMLHFYGLFGFVGTGAGRIKIYAASGIPRDYFSLILFLTAALITICILRISYQELQEKNNFITNRWPNLQLARKLSFFSVRGGVLAASLVIAIATTTAVFWNSYPAAPPMGVARMLFVSLLIFSGIMALALLIYVTDSHNRLMLYALSIILFFSCVLLYKLFGIYLLHGHLRGMHGRYFYPIVPFMLMALAVSVRRLRISRQMLGTAIFILAIMELETFVLQVMPFYGGIY